MTTEHAANPLRRARLAAKLELSDLAERTRISPAMLRHMDAGEFHRLPGGIYARAWVRAVAQALSLDPEQVLRQLENSLPGVEPPEETAKTPEPVPDQLTQRADASPWPGLSPRLPGDSGRRAAVAALDGAILTGITILVWIVASLTAGSPPDSLGAAGAIGVSFTALTLAVVYFAVFAGVGGRTPGAILLGCPADDRARTPLDLAGIGRRALATALAETSIVVDILVTGGVDQMLVRSAFRRT